MSLDGVLLNLPQWLIALVAIIFVLVVLERTYIAKKPLCSLARLSGHQTGTLTSTKL